MFLQSTEFGRFSNENSSHDILGGRFSSLWNCKFLFFSFQQEFKRFEI